MQMGNDRLAQAALRRHHIGVKSKSLRFRGNSYVFRYNTGHYDVFFNDDHITTLATSNLLEAIRLFKQQA